MRFVHLVLLPFFGLAIASEEVTTSLGRILGATLETRSGKTIHAFRGIRYAQAPINELRFQPPVPVGKWTGVYNATADGPVCPQPGIQPVSEDCLMLNVYTTKLPHHGKNPKRPVIIHLHPGGFYSATGRSNWGGPQYFMDQDIVLVTLNYRLGALGFISTGKDAPGNNGLRDQVLALKWVQDHIEHFGGDCDSVTLYGYSAGAWSITLHMVSPMSRGLFHKAIIGSGSAIGHWPLPRNQVELARKQARFLGCPDQTTPKEILECLKTKPAEDFGNSLFQFREFGFDPVLIWSPVIEENFGQERFLHEHPLKLIQEGKFEKIPVVIGITKDEFATYAFPLVANETLLETLSNNFEEYAPISFIYERGTEKSREVSRAARKFYLGDEPLSKADMEALGKLYADSIVGFPVDVTAKIIAKYNPKPVYYYEFTYQGRFSHFYLPGTNNTVPYGVVHHDDLIYTFYISELFPFFGPDFPERQMVQKLTTLWANFAKFGDPIPKKCRELDNVKWATYDKTTQKYLDIGQTLILRDHLFYDRFKFWEDLYGYSSDL